MPDNVPITAGSGTNVATDDIGGVHYQRTKMVFGADGAATDVSPTAPLPTYNVGATTGGCTPDKYIASAAANQDARTIKASAGKLMFMVITNLSTSAIRYVKLYNVASPTSASTPVQTYAIPFSTGGGGLIVPLPPEGLQFSTAIGMRITAGLADNDATAVTANDVVVSYGYV